MSESPDYFTTTGLIAAAGVTPSTFYRHVRADVGQITKARERINGFGVRWVASRCRKYLALCRARTEGRAA